MFLKNNLYAYLGANVIQNINDTVYFDEDYLSGIGFQNNWVNLQIGKGRENWGAGNGIELALSDNSNAYDYFMLASNYGAVRVNFIYGFLETTNSGINRYINARGLEWSNKKNLVLSFSETTIYSGFKRPFDLGYLNPIGSHLEVELNNRLNIVGDRNSNAVWQLHLDYKIKNQSRLSFNYLFDEFVIDPNVQIGKEHGKAYSLKFSHSIIKSKQLMLNIFISKIFVGTPTFRHGLGSNNFVFNHRPLGWKLGSDGDQTNLGLTFSKINKMILSIEFGEIRLGEESIIYRPYEPYADYMKDFFPSGNFLNNKYLKTKLMWKIHPSFFININTGLTSNSNVREKMSNGIVLLYIRKI